MPPRNPGRRMIKMYSNSTTISKTLISITERTSGQRLGEYLVDQAIVSERDIASRLSHQLGYLFVDLTKETLNPDLSVTIPEPLARRYQAVPLKRDGKSLTVAMADPLDFEAIQDISFFSDCTVKH